MKKTMRKIETRKRNVENSALVEMKPIPEMHNENRKPEKAASRDGLAFGQNLRVDRLEHQAPKDRVPYVSPRSGDVAGVRGVRGVWAWYLYEN